MATTIRRPLRRYASIFREARDANLNEADTVLRLCKFFEEVLGYDGFQDISREAEMKNQFIDVCLKIDGRVRLLVEAKAAGKQLRDRYIDQAWKYASQNNYQWVLLTNGIQWNLYHLTFDEGIEYELAFEVSLAEDNGIDGACVKLQQLHKKMVAKGGLDAFWEHATALSPASIGRSLFQESVLRTLRREIRRDTGILIDPEDLVKAIGEMLTVEVREQIGPPRVRRRRRPSTKRSASKAPAANNGAGGTPTPAKIEGRIRKS